MDFRGRELLSAEARFLADYCGEEAVRRWHARLSDSERDQLVSTYAFVEEVCWSLVRLIRRSFRAVLQPLVSQVRSFFRMCVALITGDAPESFGHQIP